MAPFDPKPLKHTPVVSRADVAGKFLEIDKGGENADHIAQRLAIRLQVFDALMEHSIFAPMFHGQIVHTDEYYTPFMERSTTCLKYPPVSPVSTT